MLLVVALPSVFLGLIDSLEGGLSLLAALVVYLAACAVRRRWPPGYLWLPFTFSVVIGAATVSYAVMTLEFSSTPTGLGLPVRIEVLLYRPGVLGVLVGGTFLAFTAVRARYF